MKKIWILMIALLCMASAACAEGLTTKEVFSAKEVKMGNTKLLMTPGEETVVYFIAPQDDSYRITTESYRDTKAALYSGKGVQPFLVSDDYRNTRRFCLKQRLEEGNKVYISVLLKEGSAPETVTLKVEYLKGEWGNPVPAELLSAPAPAPAGKRAPAPIFAPAATPVPEKPWPIGETAKVYRNGNARGGAGTEHKVLEYVVKGENVEILDFKVGSTGKDWYRIEVDGTLCWISSTLVKLNGNPNGTVDGVPVR